jgi:predicted AAA+ superfamily ATPase
MNMTDYRPRVVDGELRRKLGVSAAILIKGAKATGKTETARRRAKSEARIDTDPGIDEKMSIDPGLVLRGRSPRLLDEWQLAPELWNYVRREADDRKKPGQFILTGSADLAGAQRLHSGVGRFSVIEMRPMSWFESGISSGRISLKKILSGRRVATGDECEITIGEIITHILRGGWPANIVKSDAEAIEYVRDYVELLAESDVSKAPNTRRRRSSAKIRRILDSYSRNIATEAAQSLIVAEARGEDISLAQGTADRYIEVLKDLMIIEDLPAWRTHIRSSATLRRAEKKYFVDPSIAAACLGLDADRLLDDLNYLGLLFEAAAIRDIRVYAQAHGARVSHYRDSSGLEIDAIVHGGAGTWSAFEIKLGRDKHDAAAKNLLKLASLVEEKKAGPPASLNIVTGFGFGHTRPDGVGVIPLAELGV